MSVKDNVRDSYRMSIDKAFRKSSKRILSRFMHRSLESHKPASPEARDLFVNLIAEDIVSGDLDPNAFSGLASFVEDYFNYGGLASESVEVILDTEDQHHAFCLGACYAMSRLLEHADAISNDRVPMASSKEVILR